MTWCKCNGWGFFIVKYRSNSVLCKYQKQYFKTYPKWISRELKNCIATKIRVHAAYKGETCLNNKNKLRREFEILKKKLKSYKKETIMLMLKIRRIALARILVSFGIWLMMRLKKVKVFPLGWITMDKLLRTLKRRQTCLLLFLSLS